MNNGRMMSADAVLGRLSEVLGARNDTQLAKHLGLNRTTLSSRRNRNSIPFEACLEIADREGLSLDWLFHGQGPQYKSEAPAAGDFVYIPLYEVSASGGHGTVIDAEDQPKALAFRRDWIEVELKTRPCDLALVYVEGESMEETLRDGDVIMMDLSETRPRDGVFVIRMDDALLVKRLQALPGHQIKVVSDNPAYEPFEASLGDSLRIIGRVVWMGRRI